MFFACQVPTFTTLFSFRSQHLASRGIIVIKTDGRGSSRRGFAFESCIWGRLGQLEVDDQEAGVSGISRFCSENKV